MVLRQQRRYERAAFTLMEIIVVVAIILILASAGVFVFTGILQDQDVNRAKMDIRNIDAAVGTYNVKNRMYPSSLDILTERDPDTGAPAMLVIEALTDPWKQLYIYERDNRHDKTDKPRIYSLGPPDRPQIIDNWGTK